MEGTRMMKGMEKGGMHWGILCVVLYRFCLLCFANFYVVMKATVRMLTHVSATADWLVNWYFVLWMLLLFLFYNETYIDWHWTFYACLPQWVSIHIQLSFKCFVFMFVLLEGGVCNKLKMIEIEHLFFTLVHHNKLVSTFNHSIICWTTPDSFSFPSLLLYDCFLCLHHAWQGQMVDNWAMVRLFSTTG